MALFFMFHMQMSDKFIDIANKFCACFIKKKSVPVPSYLVQITKAYAPIIQP